MKSLEGAEGVEMLLEGVAAEEMTLAAEEVVEMLLEAEEEAVATKGEAVAVKV